MARLEKEQEIYNILQESFTFLMGKTTQEIEKMNENKDRLNNEFKSKIESEIN